METTRKRRWWQFGLRWLFVATLVVAAYAAGRAHQSATDRQEVENARIAERKAAAAERRFLEQLNQLYAEHFAKEAESVDADVFKPNRITILGACPAERENVEH
jgi:hypothetical protein